MQEGDVGSAGRELRLGEVTIDRVDYVITGSGYTKAGFIDVSKSSKVSTGIGSIPAEHQLQHHTERGAGG